MEDRLRFWLVNILRVHTLAALNYIYTAVQYSSTSKNIYICRDALPTCLRTRFVVRHRWSSRRFSAEGGVGSFITGSVISVVVVVCGSCHGLPLSGRVSPSSTSSSGVHRTTAVYIYTAVLVTRYAGIIDTQHNTVNLYHFVA